MALCGVDHPLLHSQSHKAGESTRFLDSQFPRPFFFPFRLAGHRLTAARWSRSGFTNMALLYFLTHVTTVKGRHHYSYLNSVLAVGRGESEGRAHNPRSRCSSVLTMLQQGRRGQWLTAPHLRLGMICVCVSAERDKSSQRPHD